MPTYDAPIPGNVGAAQTALLAKRAYQEALARINQRRSGTLRQYGYLGDFSPETGVLQNMRVDPNNPYGMLQETLAMNAMEDELGDQAMVDRGIRGGLARQQEAARRHVFGRRKAQLGTGLIGALGGLQEEQTGAKQAMDAALYQAQLEAARNAITNGDFSPALMDPPPPEDHGSVDVPVDPNAPERTGYAPVGTGKVLWGGAYRDQKSMIKFLLSRGVTPSEWARKHPEAAKKLGISPKRNANNALINRILGRR